jgi:hypothetical protein
MIPMFYVDQVVMDQIVVSLVVDSFHYSSPFSQKLLGHTDTAAGFEKRFMTIRVDDDEDEYDEEHGEEEEQEETPIETSSPDGRIQSCFVGRFTLSTEQLVSPSNERMVRDLDRKHVSTIAANIVDNHEMKLTTCRPLIGLLSSNQCAKAADFRHRDISSYTAIEIIDGNHNLHAQNAAFTITQDPGLLQRDVLLYAGLTDQQCKRLGIMSNRDTSTCLPMSDRDYIRLIRKEMIVAFGHVCTLKKDHTSQKFQQELFATLGFVYTVSINVYNTH